MIKLYGFTASNYHNKVKLALLEKGIAFEEVHVFPSQEPDFLARSSMGKVPFIEIDGAAIAESQVIVEFLEDAFPATPLYPKDPLGRARCRLLLTVLDMHLELQVRRLYPQSIWGRPVSEDVKKDAGKQLEKGVKALATLARFDPYLAGAEFTLADCAALSHLPVISQTTKAVYGRDYLEGITQIPSYIAKLRERPHVKKVLEDRKAGLAAFMERVNAARK